MNKLITRFKQFSGVELIRFTRCPPGSSFSYVIEFRITLQESGMYSLARIAKVFTEEESTIQVSTNAKGRNIRTNAKHLYFTIFGSIEPNEKMLLNLENQLTNEERTYND